MANDNKAVGPLASARLVTLIKAETAKKLDKTGGTLTGDLTISGAWLNVKSTDTGDGNISVDGSLVAGRGVSVLNDDKYVSLVCTGDNAAKIAGSGNNCARLAVGTPTGDNDAATKAYVDAVAGATVYVDFWPTSSDVEYIETFKAYVADLAASQTFDSVFDLVNTGNTVVARLYDNSNKANLVAESIETGISGDKELGNINFLFMNAATGTPFGLPTISDAIWLTKTNNNTVAYALYRYCPLPLPASDNSDTGKVPTINGKKWELKKPESTTTVDDAMSSTSTNPVQNKVIKQYVDGHAVSLPLTLTYANGQATGASYSEIRKAIESGRQIKLAVANTIDIIASNARNETNKSVLMFTNTGVGGDTVNISQYTVTAQASGLTCNVKSHELA